MLDGEVVCDGKKPDDPAWTNEDNAFHYAQLLDPKIMKAACRAFSMAIRKDPAGMLMSAANDWQPARSPACSSVPRIPSTAAGPRAIPGSWERWSSGPRAWVLTSKRPRLPRPSG